MIRNRNRPSSPHHTSVRATRNPWGSCSCGFSVEARSVAEVERHLEHHLKMKGKR